MTFVELKVGDTFDFVGPNRYNSFYETCTKVSTRKYSYPSRRLGGEQRPKPFDTYLASVGSKGAEVFHVNE